MVQHQIKKIVPHHVSDSDRWKVWATSKVLIPHLRYKGLRSSFFGPSCISENAVILAPPQQSIACHGIGSVDVRGCHLAIKLGGNPMPKTCHDWDGVNFFFFILCQVPIHIWTDFFSEISSVAVGILWKPLFSNTFAESPRKSLSEPLRSMLAGICGSHMRMFQCSLHPRPFSISFYAQKRRTSAFRCQHLFHSPSSKCL